MIKFSQAYRKYGIVMILGVVILFFSLTAENFFTLSNFVTILRQVSSLGIVFVSGWTDCCWRSSFRYVNG